MVQLTNYKAAILFHIVNSYPAPSMIALVTNKEQKLDRGNDQMTDEQKQLFFDMLKTELDKNYNGQITLIQPIQIHESPLNTKGSLEYDTALSSREKQLMEQCAEGLIDYAATLMFQNEPDSKAKTEIVRDLIDEISSYWGLDDSPVMERCLTEFDHRISEVETADGLCLSPDRMAATVGGLLCYTMEMVEVQGVDAKYFIDKAQECAIDICAAWNLNSELVESLHETINFLMGDQDDQAGPNMSLLN